MTALMNSAYFCGAAPNTMCFNQSTCFCPHCPQAGGVGYEYLAEHVLVPAITKLLPSPLVEATAD